MSDINKEIIKTLVRVEKDMLFRIQEIRNITKEITEENMANFEQRITDLEVKLAILNLKMDKS